jgi:ribulose-phosphate 3-epimerase
MILQGYDFRELAQRVGCRLQMGGSDQWGNIVNGIELTRRMDGTEVFGLTTPLITTADGGKMGKTTAGAVWLNADMLSPYDFWQFWRNTHDGDVGRFLRLFTDLPLDVHMMTVRACDYIDTLKKAGASSITLHSDTLEREEMIETLKYIKSLGMNAAVSLKPKYPAEDVFPFVPYIDMVLVMTVEPGFGGQKFMADQLPKIRSIRQECRRRNIPMHIEVDGGIDAATAPLCREAGANMFVAGTSVFRNPAGAEEAIRILR